MQKAQVAIIGSGPAGYTAGLYAARGSLAPLLFAGEKNGGQLMNTTVIENFPGFPKGVDGPLLMNNMREQARGFGAVIEDKYVTAVDFSVRPFRLWTQLPEGTTAEIFGNGTPEEIEKFTGRIKGAPHYVE